MENAMDNFCTVIIVAAGISRRMGTNINKQYLNLNGKPVLAHTAEKFENCPQVKQIVIGINPEANDLVQDIVNKYGITKAVIAHGGSTRQETAEKCLSYVDEKASIVLVHDGVRPFVEEKHITEVIDAVLKEDAAILAVPSKDTIKYKDETVTTLDRTKLWLAQTPQGFKKELLLEAFEFARDNQIEGTDEASLVEAYGRDVFLVEGNYSNIKITTPEDLEYSKFLLKWQESKKTELKVLPTVAPAKQKERPNVVIYTDGACSGNPGPGGYGAVLLHNGKRKEISRGFDHTTNNRMEITAVIHALQELKVTSQVDLYSDSKYVVDAINKRWVHKWQANNWMRTKSEKAQNVDLWQELMPLLDIHKVNFIWVKGHANNIENERCDLLAREAISKV